MAQRNLDIRDVGASGDLLDVWANPIFFGFDDAGVSHDWAIVGRYAVLGVLADTGQSLDALRVNVGHGLAITDAGDASADSLALVFPVVVEVVLAIVDTGDANDALALNGVYALAITDVGASGDTLNVGQALLPLLRDPLPGEVPGAVNLVENPSLEADTRGWSTSAGATLDRVSDDPWSGDWHAAVTIAAGAGLPEVRARSAEHLALDRIGAWVGSIAIQGDAAEARLLVRFTYQDGTEADREWAIVVPPVSWERVASEALPHDDARVLSRIDLVVAVPQTGAEQTLELDGAQIEDATTGGATGYVDGDQGDGYAWFGPEHASVSYREPAA